MNRALRAGGKMRQPRTCFGAHPGLSLFVRCPGLVHGFLSQTADGIKPGRARFSVKRARRHDSPDACGASGELKAGLYFPGNEGARKKPQATLIRRAIATVGGA